MWWDVAVLVLLALMWLAVRSLVRVWLDDDERTMRDYTRARERFERYFE